MNTLTLYPSPITPCDNYTIFHLAFQHGINSKTPVNKLFQELKQNSWGIHDYLHSGTALNQEKHQRIFEPQAIFTDYAHSVTFGKTWLTDCDQKELDVLQHRLRDSRTHFNQVETILLTRQPNTDWLKQKLYCYHQDQPHIHFQFSIQWVDLWLFPDTVGIIAFKTRLQAVYDHKRERPLQFDDFTTFNRYMRYFEVDTPIQVYRKDEASTPTIFWQNVLFDQWLNNGKLVNNPQNWEKFKDKDSRYSRILMAVQLQDLPDDAKLQAQWNQPQMQPMPPENLAYHATLAGYPNLHTVLLTELTTLSKAGSARGLTEQRVWQFNSNYLRQLSQQHAIGIWEYWSGMALRDACAFLSQDQNMPIMKQAEGRYYPLYVFANHLHYKLAYFNNEIMDYQLENRIRANQILDDFYKFRNQFWFKEVTIDFMGIEVFDKMKTGMDVDNKYAQILTEVNEITSFVEKKHTQGWQIFISIVLLILAPIAFIWQEFELTKQLGILLYVKEHSIFTRNIVLIVFSIILSAYLLRHSLFKWTQSIASWMYKVFNLNKS
jgi:hypothetical protein